MPQTQVVSISVVLFSVQSRPKLCRTLRFLICEGDKFDPDCTVASDKFLLVVVFILIFNAP